MEIELQEKEAWKKCRLKLAAGYVFSPDWETAIGILIKRFEKKYFEPIDHLVQSMDRKGEGFTILTAQCALIEAFASFRTGQIFN